MTRREILEKHWKTFLWNRGRVYEQMSNNGYAFIEAAMEEYVTQQIAEQGDETTDVMGFYKNEV